MLLVNHIYLPTSKIKYSEPYVERGLKKLHLIQVRTT